MAYNLLPLSTCMFKPKLWANSWILSWFHSKTLAPTHPLQHVISWYTWCSLSLYPLCPSFEVRAQVTTQPSLLIFQLSSYFKSRFSHLSIVGFLQCVCIQPNAPFGYPCFCCVHDNKCIRTHDAMHDAFPFIALEFNFHGVWENCKCPFQLRFSHLVKDFSLSSFENGIHTLLNDIIVVPTHIDLIPWLRSTWGFVALEVKF